MVGLSLTCRIGKSCFVLYSRVDQQIIMGGSRKSASKESASKKRVQKRMRSKKNEFKKRARS